MQILQIQVAIKAHVSPAVRQCTAIDLHLCVPMWSRKRERQRVVPVVVVVELLTTLAMASQKVKQCCSQGLRKPELQLSIAKWEWNRATWATGSAELTMPLISLHVCNTRLSEQREGDTSDSEEVLMSNVDYTRDNVWGWLLYEIKQPLFSQWTFSLADCNRDVEM